MYKKDGLIFLDLHKSGSSSIQKMLYDYVDDKGDFFKKHEPVKGRYNLSDIAFMAVKCLSKINRALSAIATEQPVYLITEAVKREVCT
ncbi:hypothetical protein QWY74_12045, partial [Halomonas almeriensis]|uniref:hypothetical protein n=1 Tax=Halomonas almeriensis TaxID=308163 RepID=UPI0025B2A72E